MADGEISEKPKIFSYEEAAALLPEVRRLTEAAYAQVEALWPEGSAETAPPAVQSQLDAIVLAWARVLMERGLQVKGLWLVDFDNGSGYYCWRYPEAGLHFFHSYEDGFAGRMRIQ